MNDDELVQILEDAGLSPYQAEAYVTLLELGNASAMDVADNCDVPDPRIYDVLRDLESKGYAETYQQDSLTARAHDPNEVLEDLRSRSSEYLDAAEEIEERWKQPAVTEHEVSIVKRFDTVLNRAKTLVDDAETQIQFAGHVDQFRAVADELAAAHDRGVTVKVSLWTTDDGPAVPGEDELSGVCTETRLRSIPSAFVVIVDRTNTCFAPHDQSVNEYGVLVTDRSYTFIFHWFFISALWENWETIYTERTDEKPTTFVDIRYCVREVERLLNEGATVEANVRGYETATNERTELSGTIVRAHYDGEPTPDGELPLSRLSGRVYVAVDTGEQVVEVGGWGAVLEEIEGESITITDVRYD